MTRRLKDLACTFHLDSRDNRVVRRTDFARCPRPVLLLHGLFSTRRMLEVLERRLRQDGYGVWSIHLGGLLDEQGRRGIEAAAGLVRHKVERLYTRYSLGPLTIIGHSKGGLIGRYYVERLGGHRRVSHLLTLGTPHQGTPMAWLGCALLGWVSRGLWQLTPVSPFIQDLREGTFPGHVRLTSIYSKADRLAPFPSACLDDARAGNLFNVEVPGVRHGELLSHRMVYEAIRHELALGYGEPRPRPELRLVSL